MLNEAQARKELLRVADAYGQHYGLKPSSVSKVAHGDSPFLRKFRAGTASITLRKYEKMVKFLSRRLPDSAWPKGIERPCPPNKRLPKPKPAGASNGKKAKVRRRKKKRSPEVQPGPTGTDATPGTERVPQNDPAANAANPAEHMQAPERQGGDDHG